jgi:hypothetical protein
MFGGLLDEIFETSIGCDEAREGKVPVIWFTGMRDQHFPSHSATYKAPVSERIGWLPRAMIPAFAEYEITVPARPLIATRISFAQLGSPSATTQQRLADKLVTPAKSTLTRPTMRRGAEPPKRDLRDDLDDEIPENL